MTAPAVPGAEVWLRALDVLDVVLVTADPTEAAEHARSMLAGLDEDTLRRIAAYLARLAVGGMVRGRSAGAVKRAIDGWRLEATAQLPEVPR